MGALLMQYYEQAEKAGGIKASLRLAMKTAISSTKARTVPDSPELLKAFEKAWSDIKKEL